VSRFCFTSYSSADLDEIRAYHQTIPDRFGMPIRRALRAMLHEIAAHSHRGAIHSEATRPLGQQVNTRAVPPYRIFYRDRNGSSEILAILHTAQDVSALLAERLQ